MSANVEEGGSEWITINKAADILGVSRRTVYNWMDTGKLPYRLTPGRTRRVRRDDLLSEPMIGPLIGQPK